MVKTRAFVLVMILLGMGLGQFALGSSETSSAECLALLHPPETVYDMKSPADRGKVMEGLRSIFLPEVYHLSERSGELDAALVKTILLRQKQKFTTARFPFIPYYHPLSLQHTVEGSKEANEWLFDLRRTQNQNEYHGTKTRHWQLFDQKQKEFYIAVPKQGMLTEGLEHLDLKFHRLFIGGLTPVGEYGEDFALTNLLTQTVLMEWAGNVLAPRLEKVWDAHSQFLRRYAARAHEVPTKESVLGSIYEGFVSINQAVNLLLASKITGVNDYRTALKLVLLDNVNPAHPNVLQDFVQRLSMGNLGPITLSGRYSAQTLQVDEAGVPQLSDNLKETLGILKRKRQQEKNEGRSIESHDTAVGCPMGFPKGSGHSLSGIQYAAMIYYHTFIQVDDLVKSGILKK